MLRAVRVAKHAGGGRTQAVERRRCFAQLLDDRERIAVERERLGLDAIVRVDRPSAQPAFEEVRLRTRHAGVRRAQEAVELSAPAAEPHEAEQAEQRAAERCLRQPRPRSDGDRNTERAEPGFERRAPALERGTDDRDLLRRRPAADQGEHLLADELQRRARSGAFEEAHRSAGGRRFADVVDEQLALEMRERGAPGTRPAQHLDPPVRERTQVVHRRPERLERRPALFVRQRNGDFGAARERAEQLPLGAGQVLEAVGEHGLAVPRFEVRLKPRDCVPPKRVPVPSAEADELRAIGGEETTEVALERLRLEQPGLELGEGRRERVREACEARGTSEPVQRRVPDDAADEQAALSVGHDRPRVAVPADDLPEDVVECPDRAAEQRAAAREQVPLDAFDVRSVRDDEDRAAVENGQIPLQQKRDFARVGRPCDEAEPHRAILDLGPDGSGARFVLRAWKRLRSYAAVAAAFGRLPRRAVGVPGIFPAQSSQRSACLAPRRASVYVRRRVAPFPSSTSLPQLSQTSTVFLATNSSSGPGNYA